MATADQNRESRRMQLILPNKRLIIIMVGLPARGKSYMAKKILRYLLHLRLNAKIVNLGSYRRNKTKDTTVGQASAKFFDPKNKKNLALRDQICREGLTDLIAWWTDGGQVGIFDATNVSLRRRDLIRTFLKQKAPQCQYDIETLYVESICNDNKVVENNIINAKLKNPDYCTVERETAIQDFWERIRMYESDYQKVKAMEGSYIKVIDVGNDVVGHSIHNYISLRILYFLMHLNLHRKTFENEVLRKKPLISKFANNNNNNNNNCTNSNNSQNNKTKNGEGTNVVPLHPFMRRSSFLLWNEGNLLTPKLPPAVTPDAVTNKSIIPEDIDTDTVKITPISTNSPPPIVSDSDANSAPSNLGSTNTTPGKGNMNMNINTTGGEFNQIVGATNRISAATGQYFPHPPRFAPSSQEKARVASAANAVAMATVTAGKTMIYRQPEQQQQQQQVKSRSQSDADAAAPASTSTSTKDSLNTKLALNVEQHSTPIEYEHGQLLAKSATTRVSRGSKRVLPNLMPVKSMTAVETTLGTQQQITPHTRRVRPSVTRTSTIFNLIKRRKESSVDLTRKTNQQQQQQGGRLGGGRGGDVKNSINEKNDKNDHLIVESATSMTSMSSGVGVGDESSTDNLLRINQSGSSLKSKSNSQSAEVSDGSISIGTDDSMNEQENDEEDSTVSESKRFKKKSKGKDKKKIEQVKERMKKSVEREKHFQHDDDDMENVTDAKDDKDGTDDKNRSDSGLNISSSARNSMKDDYTKSSWMDLEQFRQFSHCSIPSCNREFDENNRKYLCRLCNRVICGKCSQKVPAKGHPNVKIRICDICLFETDSEDDIEEDFSDQGDEAELSLDQVTSGSNKDAAISESLIDGINSIDTLLNNLPTNSKDTIKLELLKISQQLGDVVKSLQIENQKQQKHQTQEQQQE